MKNIIILLIVVFPGITGFSQGWVSISGTVYDVDNGMPIPGQSVTIMSDSANGTFYYNVVVTDSLGHYFDLLPVAPGTVNSITVQVTDCNGLIMSFAIWINPNTSQYIQDFYICTATVICQAWFTFRPEPEGSATSYRFLDASTGNGYTTFWSFGDGTFSEEQNPLHAFPGPGTYEICLTIQGTSCQDAFCMSLTISDTVYRQIYGQVFAGNLPVQSCEVYLYSQAPAGGGYTLLEEGYPVDSNGVFYFTLVPEGVYLLQAVPAGSDSYLPAYFGDAISWQQAAPIIIGEPENPYNIHLEEIGVGNALSGPGSILGQVNTVGMERSGVGLINILLLNENYIPLGFSDVNEAGKFSFPSVPFGQYFLKAELSGVLSDMVGVMVDQVRPEAMITLNYTGNNVLGQEELGRLEVMARVYPNPSDGPVSVEIMINDDELFRAELFTASGKIVSTRDIFLSPSRNTFSYDLSEYNPGLYILKLSSDKRNGSLKILRK